MRREVQPEILDSLPPNHPDALHNRRDLRLTNRLMGNPRWWLRTLPPLLRGDERILELGAGTGDLGARLNAHGLATDGLDLWPRPSHWPAGRAWHRADLLSFTGYEAYDAIIGNLIFHQFTADELAALGRALRRSARLIIACEPARVRFSQVAYAGLGPLLGVNHVSLHDAHVSIAAGFRELELARMLGLEAPDWSIRCTTGSFGAYRMVALRRP
jgi:hypothetical protein